MTDPSWEHGAEARAALHAIVTDPELGATTLSSPQGLSNLLKDLLPDAPREKSILVAAAEADLAGMLRDHVGQGMDPGTAVRLTASSFAASTPFTPEACSWVANELAIALGMVSASASPPGGPAPGGPAPGGQQAAPAGRQTPPPASPPPGQAAAQAAAQSTIGPWAQQGPGRPVPGGPIPNGPMPNGPIPNGPMPNGPMPNGPIPNGPMPNGPMPNGPMPGGTLPPGKPGGKRGVLFGGGAVIAVIAVIAVVLGMRHPTPTPKPRPSTPQAQPSTQYSSPSTPAPQTSVQSLATIMNAPGSSPVGSNCVQAKLYKMDSAAVVGRLFCSTTTTQNVIVWAYQFDNYGDYQAAVANMNSYVGFTASSAAADCPPASGTEGLVGWHSTSNPLFPQRAGQSLECFTNSGSPTLIWTMPSQDVFFIAKDDASSATLTTLLNWWKTLSYG